MKLAQEYLPTAAVELSTEEEFEVLDGRIPEWMFIHRKFEWSNVSGPAHRVYCHLVARANDGYQAWPSIATIAKYTRLNKDTVRVGIAELLAYNFMSARKRQHNTTVYTLTPASQWVPPPGNHWGELTKKKNPNTETRGIENHRAKVPKPLVSCPNTETRVDDRYPFKGTHKEEEVLPLMVSDSENAKNQEADPVASAEQKKTAGRAMDVDKENCTQKTESTEEVKLPSEPFHLYKPEQAKKWQALQLKLGADWSDAETMQAFKDLEKHRHPLTGRWRTGKTELTDFGLALSERILQNRRYQAQNHQSGKETSTQRLYVLEAREKKLQKAIDNHPANRRSMCYVEQNVTPSDRLGYRELLNALAQVEKDIRDL